MNGARVEAIVPVSDLERAMSFFGDTLGDTLGLQAIEEYDQIGETPMVRYQVAGGTLAVYKSVGAGESKHTVAGFVVDDIESTVDRLRQKGVTFEEYDTGPIKTDNGIATIGNIKGAWFKDPDGNILGIGQY
jgi:predicted enzyme related to lactoylglutathione lyase